MSIPDLKGWPLEVIQGFRTFEEALGGGVNISSSVFLTKPAPKLRVLFIGLVLLLSWTGQKIAQVLTLIEPAQSAAFYFYLFTSLRQVLRLVNINLAPRSFSLTLCRHLSLLVTSSFLLTSQSSKSVVNGGFESEFES